MDNNPKISVIIGVYNGEKYLAKSIQSILNQSFTNFELIIINDASSDNSLEIIKRFAKKDQRIKTIINEENIGLTKSLNKGIKLAKGEYIARQDADDISLPHRLKKQFEFMQKNRNIFLCGTNAEYIDENGRHLSRSHVPVASIKIKKKLEQCNCLIHSSIMFRNNKIIYREKFKYSQDYDLYLNLISKGCELANLNESLIKLRLNDEAITLNKYYQQNSFASLARDFYTQRLRKGEDDYDHFNPQVILSRKNTSKEKVLLERKIEIFLKSRNYYKAKEYLKKYINNKKANKVVILLYSICIYFPLSYRVYRKIFYHD